MPYDMERSSGPTSVTCAKPDEQLAHEAGVAMRYVVEPAALVSR